MKTGIELITEERKRQIKQEGYSAFHDDQHQRGDLSMAAMAYLEADDGDGNELFTVGYSFWPWGKESYKPKDRLSNLIRAGALIAAEIDRLQRLKALAQ